MEWYSRVGRMELFLKLPNMFYIFALRVHKRDRAGSDLGA